MLKIFIVCYLLLALLTIIYRRKQLKADLSIQATPIKGFIYKILMVMAAVLLWPLLLAHKESQESDGLTAKDILLEVSDAFGDVARERREKINGATVEYIVSKFLLIYQEMGLWAYRKHLKYEVEKYRREGLREDYIKGLS